jgi:hypothetical protein
MHIFPEITSTQNFQSKTYQIITEYHSSAASICTLIFNQGELIASESVPCAASETHVPTQMHTHHQNIRQKYLTHHDAAHPAFVPAPPLHAEPIPEKITPTSPVAPIHPEPTHQSEKAKTIAIEDIHSSLSFHVEPTPSREEHLLNDAMLAFLSTHQRRE